MSTEADTIDGFPERDPNCRGCGRPLELKNAWMTDGCPCNSLLGVNSMNETRWRLLMDLQQRQFRESFRLQTALREIEGLTWGGKGETAIHVIASTALTRQE